MIELKKVTKTFYQKNRPVTALDDVSLVVPAGKIFGVIGSSGAGKSTLIRCVNLLERPGSGEVIVDGKNLMELPASRLAKERRQMGMIFQHFNLMSSRTVFGNIAFPLELDNMPRRTINQRVSELLKLVELEEKINDYPASLSGGQKQRVAIARTLANNPKILLCDEATSALDPGTTKSILALLKDINQRLQITILLITHEMNVVKAICDNVAVISQGKLIEQGSVSEIFAHPKTMLAQSFITSTLHFEIPQVYQQRLRPPGDDTGNPILKLSISGQTADEPILSQAARLFSIDTKIISAQMEYAGEIKFGIVLVELSGNRDNFKKTIQFFRDQQISIEIIGYV